MSTYCLGAFKHKKAKLGAYSVITNLRVDLCLKLYGRFQLSTSSTISASSQQPTAANTKVGKLEKKVSVSEAQRLADAVYLISSVFKSIFLNTGWILSAKKNLDYILAQIRILLNWKITRSSGFTFVVCIWIFCIIKTTTPTGFFFNQLNHHRTDSKPQ